MTSQALSVVLENFKNSRSVIQRICLARCVLFLWWYCYYMSLTLVRDPVFYPPPPPYSTMGYAFPVVLMNYYRLTTVTIVLFISLMIYWYVEKKGHFLPVWLTTDTGLLATTLISCRYSVYSAIWLIRPGTTDYGVHYQFVEHPKYI